MINFKQEELIEKLVNYVREKFPEVSFIGIKYQEKIYAMPKLPYISTAELIGIEKKLYS